MSGSSVAKRARLEDESVATLGKDVWGLIVANLFPQMENVTNTVLALQLRGGERERVLKTALRSYFSRDIGGNSALTICKVWLWFQRAQMETLSVAETIRFFPLSKRDISRMVGEKTTTLQLETVMVLLFRLNRNVAAKSRAIFDIVAQKSRIYSAARASLVYLNLDPSLLWRSDFVASQLRKCLRTRTRDTTVTDAAIQVKCYLFYLKTLTVHQIIYFFSLFPGV